MIDTVKQKYESQYTKIISCDIRKFKKTQERENPIFLVENFLAWQNIEREFRQWQTKIATKIQ